MSAFVIVLAAGMAVGSGPENVSGEMAFVDEVARALPPVSPREGSGETQTMASRVGTETRSARGTCSWRTDRGIYAGGHYRWEDGSRPLPVYPLLLA